MDPMALLAAGFDVSLLEREPEPVVLLDTAGIIRWVNPAWTRPGPEVAARFGIGSCYFDGISGELREHFEELLRSCIATGTALEQLYECSTPSELREFHVRFLPLGGAGALVVHSIVASRPVDREVREPIEATYCGADGVITQCSHCRRIRRRSGAGWDWVPAWVGSPPSRVSHGLCPACIGFYWGR